MKNFLTSGIAFLVFFLFLHSSAPAAEKKPVEVKKRDKCPVCGMFVARYPDWIAQIIYDDGTYDVFDGPKDMFKYYFNMEKYNPARKQSRIAVMYVTEYYSAGLMDVRKVFFIPGSNVYGPMGAELVPVATSDAAKEFMHDHKGTGMLRFEEVKPGDLK
ncbi:MAG: nitrous oxide reductase accessory protein NosL [Candidatus Sulfobium sp.]